jgi:hypothetical protein
VDINVTAAIAKLIGPIFPERLYLLEGGHTHAEKRLNGGLWLVCFPKVQDAQLFALGSEYALDKACSIVELSFDDAREIARHSRRSGLVLIAYDRIIQTHEVPPVGG